MARKKFDFGVKDNLIVSNETIKGFMLDIGAVVTGGATVAAIADLNEISLDIHLYRGGNKPVEIFSGDLDDLLTALYAQTPSYALQKTAFGKTYKIKVDFLGGILQIGEMDKLVIKCKVNSAAFTSIDTSEDLSYINLITIPAIGYNTAIPVVKAHALPTGDIRISKSLGNNVHKIVAAFDYTAAYTASTKAKVEEMTITAQGGYEKTVSQELIELENIFYFDDNPESSVAQAVLFWEDAVIHGAKLDAKLDKAVDAFARLSVVHKEVI